MTATRNPSPTRRPASLAPVADGDIYAAALAGRLSFAAVMVLLAEADAELRRSDRRLMAEVAS